MTFDPPLRAQDDLKNEARVVFFINGRSKLFTPTESLSLQSGDCMIMKCDNFVNDWDVNVDNSQSQIITFRLSPQVLEKIYNNKLPEIFSPSQNQVINAVIKITSSETLSEFIDHLTFYLDRPKVITEELLSIKLRELIFLLSNLTDNDMIKRALETLFLAKNYKLYEIIQSNLFTNLKLDDLAFLCGLSLSSFQREFKKIFGMPPAKYINQKRIEEAKKLLANTEIRISEVAFLVGFESLSHFSKVFSIANNMSPSKFQKMKQKVQANEFQ